MSDIRKTLEFSIPAEEVLEARKRAISSIQKQARLPGFRPGKAPASIIERRFEQDIRQDVLKDLIGKHFWKRAEEEGLAVAGMPEISDVHLHAGEPLRFKAEFEVAPEIELQEYKGVTVPYQDPEVSDEDLDRRIGEIREQKAQYVNVDPRPIQDGDHAVVSLESVAGVEQPVKQDEMMIEVGGTDTLPGFSENLRGASPDETKEFDVVYPEDYGQPKLAGKTVRFRTVVKGIRRKELPELNDEFAQDLGDYVNMEELREAVRRSLTQERQYVAEQAAKTKLLDALVDMHDFPVPEAYIERQIESEVERYFQELAGQGIDPRGIQLDWEKLKESRREKAIRDVKASLLLGKIADREAIHATNEEVDREVQRIAKHSREPVAATRMRLEKENALGRIASRIRTEKTLNFLFEHATKIAGD